MAFRFFFFFDDMRHNLLMYFLITTLVLYIGPERIMPSLRRDKHVPIVNAPVGDIMGTTMTTRKGLEIFAYRGIPYVHPPVGELRFKRPRAFEDKGWEGIFEARGTASGCVQPTGMSWIPFIGQEDCLQLNVYVPAERPSKPKNGLPVMVWFHGGGFMGGETNHNLLYGPRHLLDRDVILVTANYRLGPLGFLNLGTTDEDGAGGNQGMWDQYEVMRWVQRNINAFGGDKKRVTIFGESAGGMSVSFHLASRKSRGLFSAAIIQSGPIHLPFVEGDLSRPYPELHSEFAKKNGCPANKDKAETIKCLQSKSTNEIMEHYRMFDQCNSIATDSMAFPAIWAPTSDHTYAKDPFFNDDPRKSLEKGEHANVPVMIGIMKDEGLINTAFLLQRPDLVDELRENWTECAANNFLGKFFLKDASKYKDKAEKIKSFYLGDDKPVSLDGDSFQSLTELFTDPGFFYGSDLTAKILSRKNKVFYYHFDHLGSFSVGDLFKVPRVSHALMLIQKMFGFHESATSKMGVSHADDILYLFDIMSAVPVTFLPDERDQKMIDFMVDLWTNFAINHDPNARQGQEGELLSDSLTNQPKWLPYGTKDTKYVRLEGSQIIVGPEEKRDKRLRFWQDMLRDKL